VALVLGALLVDAQVRGWNEDAMVISAFARSFNGTERSLRTLLVTNDVRWANESVWWGAVAADLAFNAYRRGGFPSGSALGLTWPNIDCSYQEFWEFMRGLADSPSGLNDSATIQIVERFAGLYGNLWAELRTVRPGAGDPLTQFGPDRIQSIRGVVVELRTLGERWNRFCLPANYPS
jgi:hypothetical protein